MSRTYRVASLMLSLFMFSIFNLFGCTYKAKTPVSVYEVQLPEGEQVEFLERISVHALRADFSIENIGVGLPPRDGRKVIYLKLTRRDGTIIEINNFVKAEVFSMSVYAEKKEAAWEQATNDLLGALPEEWSDQISRIRSGNQS